MKIGIVGASSQVGASVAHFLSAEPGADVTCFVRSPYGNPYFRLVNLSSRAIDLSDREGLVSQLGEMDTVVDFSYPRGSLHSIRATGQSNTRAIVESMRSGSAYIYMSSLMALGMSPGAIEVRKYAISRSPYARIKRAIESTAMECGQRKSVKVYLLRLGFVHGFLQAVSLGFRQRLTRGSVAIQGRPGDATNTIFPSAISESILACASGAVSPGTYSAVSNPQWTLEQLYRYYLDYYGLQCELLFQESPRKPGRPNDLKQITGRALRGLRPMIDAYVVMNLPRLATLAAGKYRERALSTQATESSPQLDAHLLGTPPEIIRLAKSDPATVAAAERAFQKQYYEALAARRLRSSAP
jgi:nucleoside-diphosphate-sugar epimerase